MKSLICINSCNRLSEVKRNIIPYLSYCSNNDDFDFILSLDGDNQEYIEFCNQWEIPLIYSEQREGVGLSKNRVLSFFNQYDYYFFIEDDIELINSNIFSKFISIFELTGYHHMSITPYRSKIGLEEINNETITFANFGGAHFNFFTHIGLEKVGGWHTRFAKHKRFGHTEHTYRFYFQGLIPHPFCVLESGFKDILIHFPEMVTKSSVKSNHNKLVRDEQELVDSKLDFFPLQTISEITFNKFNLSSPCKPSLLKANDRYFLLNNSSKRKAKSSYIFHSFKFEKKIIKKLILFINALFLYPTNNTIKHYVKTQLFGKK